MGGASLVGQGSRQRGASTGALLSVDTREAEGAWGDANFIKAPAERQRELDRILSGGTLRRRGVGQTLLKSAGRKTAGIGSSLSRLHFS